MKRMKGSRLLLLIGLLSMGISACQNAVSNLDKTPIQFTGHIDVMARTTDLDQQSTELAEGRQVGLTILHADNAHTNGIWKVGTDGLLINMGEEVYWGNEEIAVYGYHPYQENWTNISAEYSFLVDTDQSSDDGYLNSDLLWVSGTCAPYTGVVPLTFKHKLAKINVVLSSDEIDDLSDATISVCGTNIITMFNLQTGELSSASEVIKDIKAGVTTNTSLTSSCIIVPQTVAEGTSFIKVDIQGKTYTYTLSRSINFASGKVYMFSLEIINGELGDVTGSASDIPWGD